MKWLLKHVVMPMFYLGTMYICTFIMVRFEAARVHFNTRLAREQYRMELDRLMLVDNAQAFAKRCFGLAEMEAARASDLEGRLKCSEAVLADTEAALEAAHEKIRGFPNR